MIGSVQRVGDSLLKCLSIPSVIKNLLNSRVAKLALGLFGVIGGGCFVYKHFFNSNPTNGSEKRVDDKVEGTLAEQAAEKVKKLLQTPGEPTDKPLAEAYLPFHQIIPGLYLGNQAVFEYLKACRYPGLVAINNLNKIDNEGYGWGAELGSNPYRMDKLPGLIVTLYGQSVYDDGRDGSGSGCVAQTPYPDLSISGMTHLNKPVMDDDTGWKEFLREKDAIFAAMDKAVLAEESILVHCQSGAHRSAAVVCSYLTERGGISFKEAHTLVQGIRTAVKNIDRGMISKAHHHYRSAAPKS